MSLATTSGSAFEYMTLHNGWVLIVGRIGRIFELVLEMRLEISAAIFATVNAVVGKFFVFNAMDDGNASCVAEMDDTD